MALWPLAARPAGGSLDAAPEGRSVGKPGKCCSWTGAAAWRGRVHSDRRAGLGWGEIRCHPQGQGTEKPTLWHERGWCGRPGLHRYPHAALSASQPATWSASHRSLALPLAKKNLPRPGRKLVPSSVPSHLLGAGFYFVECSSQTLWIDFGPESKIILQLSPEVLECKVLLSLQPFGLTVAISYPYN